MDREKTIEDLKQLAKEDWILHLNDPDVKGIAKAINETAKAVLAMLNEQKEEIENLKQTCQSMMEGVCLLKEQEAIPVREDKINKCECGETVCRYWHPKFCGFCGRELLWY